MALHDSECREYARSLINNLSLISGLILIPSELNTQAMCNQLQALHNQGFNLNLDQNMRKLIQGTPSLNASLYYIALKKIIAKITILEQPPE
jgi:hypothetical protein